MPVYRVQINLEIDTESKQTKLVNQRMFEGMPPTELVGGKRRGRPRKALPAVKVMSKPQNFANFSFHPGVSE
jgi:hypothetical protein